MEKANEEAMGKRLRRAFDGRVPEGWFDWRGLQTNGTFFESGERSGSPYSSLFVTEGQKQGCVEALVGGRDASVSEKEAVAEDDVRSSSSSEDSTSAEESEHTFRLRVQHNERHREERRIQDEKRRTHAPAPHPQQTCSPSSSPNSKSTNPRKHS